MLKKLLIIFLRVYGDLACTEDSKNEMSLGGCLGLDCDIT